MGIESMTFALPLKTLELQLKNLEPRQFKNYTFTNNPGYRLQNPRQLYHVRIVVIRCFDNRGRHLLCYV